MTSPRDMEDEAIVRKPKLFSEEEYQEARYQGLLFCIECEGFSVPSRYEPCFDCGSYETLSPFLAMRGGYIKVTQ